MRCHGRSVVMVLGGICVPVKDMVLRLSEYMREGGDYSLDT